MKMLRELAALGWGLEGWVTESKGGYVNFRLTKNLSGNLSAESSWCGWMADEGVVDNSFNSVYLWPWGDLDSHPKHSEFFFKGPGKLWSFEHWEPVIWPALSQMCPAAARGEEGNGLGDKHWRSDPEHERVERGGEGQRHHEGASYRAWSTHSLELHTHTHTHTHTQSKRNSDSPHLSLFLFPQGMSLLIVP